MEYYIFLFYCLSMNKSTSHFGAAEKPPFTYLKKQVKEMDSQ